MNNLVLDDLTLCKFDEFNGVRCNIWRTKNGETFVTRDQIGEALEYKNPNTSIETIHRRNKDRLDKYSVTIKMMGTDKKMYNTYLYNTKGIYEICRWSKQPKANDFMDWTWDLLEGIRKNELEINRKKIEEYEPKVESFNQLMESYNNLSMLQVAKVLKISGRNKIFKILREEKILMSSSNNYNLPYQQYIDLGYFTVVIKLKLIGNKIIEFPTTMVSSKGLEYLNRRLQKRYKNNDLLKQVI